MILKGIMILNIFKMIFDYVYVEFGVQDYN